MDELQGCPIYGLRYRVEEYDHYPEKEWQAGQKHIPVKRNRVVLQWQAINGEWCDVPTIDHDEQEHSK